MMGIVESVKGASDIYAPISGKVTAVNKTLEAKPSIINKDPLNLGSAMVPIFGSLCRVAVQDPDGRLERPWSPHGRGSIQDLLHRGRALNVKIGKSAGPGSRRHAADASVLRPTTGCITAGQAQRFSRLYCQKHPWVEKKNPALLPVHWVWQAGRAIAGTRGCGPPIGLIGSSWTRSRPACSPLGPASASRSWLTR